MNWYIDALTKKYAQFSGRARRTEFWMFVLFDMIAIIVLSVIDSYVLSGVTGGIPLLTAIYYLGTLIPALAVTVRRLHDTDHGGIWLLTLLIPLANVVFAIILFIFYVTEGTRGENNYGPDPKR